MIKQMQFFSTRNNILFFSYFSIVQIQHPSAASLLIDPNVHHLDII